MLYTATFHLHNTPIITHLELECVAFVQQYLQTDQSAFSNSQWNVTINNTVVHPKLKDWMLNVIYLLHYNLIKSIHVARLITSFLCRSVKWSCLSMPRSISIRKVNWVLMNQEQFTGTEKQLKFLVSWLFDMTHLLWDFKVAGWMMNNKYYAENFDVRS